MKHLSDCNWSESSGCLCVERIFLEQATDEERADYAARNSPTIRPRLDISATQWRGRAS